jgi:hypothetical protein
MIEKIDIDYDSPCRVRQEYGQKINELARHANLVDPEEISNQFHALSMAIKHLTERVEKLETRADNVQPDYVTTSYMTDGHTKEYFGQNGASVVTDHPLPAGYVITIKESETKGGDNE